MYLNKDRKHTKYRTVLYTYNSLFKLMQLKKYPLKLKGGIRRAFSNQETE